PGRPFTVAVVAGLAAVSAGTPTALAAGAAQAAGPVAKAAAAVTTGLGGGGLGSLGGLLGAWLGVWVPGQLAPTRAESKYLWQRGKRILLITVLFTGLLAVLVWSFAGGRMAVVSYLVLLGAWFAALWGYIAVEVVFMARAVKRLRADAASS